MKDEWDEKFDLRAKKWLEDMPGLEPSIRDMLVGPLADLLSDTFIEGFGIANLNEMEISENCEETIAERTKKRSN